MKGNLSSLNDGGQKLTEVELEEHVLSWINKLHANMLRVRIKLIMFKAKSIFHEKCGNNEAMRILSLLAMAGL